ISDPPVGWPMCEVSASVRAFEDRPDLIRSVRPPEEGAPTGMLSAGPPTTYRLEVKMRKGTKRGPGPSHLLITPDHAGNVVGIDPHKRTLTATVVDARAGTLGSEHFRVSGDGHRALEAWA